MPKKREVNDLTRQLEALKFDLNVAKQEHRFSHTHLANGIYRLGRALTELAKSKPRRAGQRM